MRPGSPWSSSRLGRDPHHDDVVAADRRLVTAGERARVRLLPQIPHQGLAAGSQADVLPGHADAACLRPPVEEDHGLRPVAEGLHPDLAVTVIADLAPLHAELILVHRYHLAVG